MIYLNDIRRAKADGMNSQVRPSVAHQTHERRIED
jgi:hypothetical protein